MKDQLAKVREILELDVVVDNVLSADLEAAHKALDTIAQAGDGVSCTTCREHGKGSGFCSNSYHLQFAQRAKPTDEKVREACYRIAKEIKSDGHFHLCRSSKDVANDLNIILTAATTPKQSDIAERLAGLDATVKLAIIGGGKSNFDRGVRHIARKIYPLISDLISDFEKQKDTKK